MQINRKAKNTLFPTTACVIATECSQLTNAIATKMRAREPSVYSRATHCGAEFARGHLSKFDRVLRRRLEMFWEIKLAQLQEVND